jgi:hypothetical protein
MTPGNIVGMAILAGLDAIAITDHQSVANCEAAMAIAEAMDGPLVLPGMEVESSEEIHLICLFPDLSSAMTMAGQVQDSLMPIKNRPDIFGEQLLFNEDDECIGHEDRLLLQACGLSCDAVAKMTLELGGVCIPAHLDRESNSMQATLGLVPPDFPAATVELSPRVNPETYLKQHADLTGRAYVVSSDAHHLVQVDGPGFPLPVEDFSDRQAGIRQIIAALRHPLSRCYTV